MIHRDDEDKRYVKRRILTVLYVTNLSHSGRRRSVPLTYLECAGGSLHAEGTSSLRGNHVLRPPVVWAAQVEAASSPVNGERGFAVRQLRSPCDRRIHQGRWFGVETGLCAREVQTLIDELPLAARRHRDTIDNLNGYEQFAGELAVKQIAIA
jgi:hypothetical protein